MSRQRKEGLSLIRWDWGLTLLPFYPWKPWIIACFMQIPSSWVTGEESHSTECLHTKLNIRCKRYALVKEPLINSLCSLANKDILHQVDKNMGTGEFLELRFSTSRFDNIRNWGDKRWDFLPLLLRENKKHVQNVIT